MRFLRSSSFLTIPAFFALPCLVLVSCGGDAAEEPVDLVDAVSAEGEVEAPLSGEPEAQALYDEAMEMLATDRPRAIENLRKAIDLDPDFLAAIATTSYQLAWIYQNWDRSVAVKEEALSLAQRAEALDPNHEWSISAMAAYHYRIEKDYDAAMEIYTRGTQLFPESSHFLRMSAHVARRQGEWDKALEILEHSESIATSNDALQAIIENHRYNRRWDEMIAAGEEHLRRNPEGTFGPSAIAWGAYYKTGDTQSVRDYHATRPATVLTQNRWRIEMMDGIPAAALAVMDASDTEMFSGQYSIAPRSYYRGVALQSLGRQAEADAALLSAKEAVEAMLPEFDHDCRVYASLGLIYAMMGDGPAATEAAKQAVDMIPPGKDALVGPYNVLNLAEVHSLLGEAELAVEQIEYLFTIPAPMTKVGLEVRGIWDYIRDHPSFRALVEG